MGDEKKGKDYNKIVNVEIDEIDDDDDAPASEPNLIKCVSSRKYEELGELLNHADSVSSLYTYLKNQLRFPDAAKESIREAFERHGIDGYAFQNLNDLHIVEMKIDPPLKLGQRLHLLMKTKKVRRAVRYKIRREVIMEGNCVVSPPGIRSDFELTPSFIRFTHQVKRKHIETDDAPQCCGPTTIIETTQDERYVDHVDISLISDIDVDESVLHKTLETPGFFPCSKPHIDVVDDARYCVYISLNIKNEDGMFVSKDSHSDDATTSVLAVHLETKQIAEEFQKKLQDLMNETQYMEGRGQALGERGSGGLAYMP